ncbi:putative 1-aminocyclopropane-1-carboxylate synthase [Helianthus annuus]|uniref:1-aminocyclopropane-1-carboxylate synthase n=1 Tax=Helianthus annuus TaxID=4232 RepID=A0A251UZR5_HELAN|nr:1-aminocyclopropane-1-carboxylate synthase 7 [Helianthus annuus]KAF5810273.1 putative 1-aminocyclopropane-1-carboxylate synthase [Helianthus annuus]KAJ0581138.1 putative 1-aminocyclopropane-1-carboxylate synthase [Helianthus annuus]KAJ0588971.1 putative 1-aminocyclopropane-1-carboxylate synthase [Helianthus annuus]KAJ0597082.1 putative 1-aminocyclopropane-1-carboxylate synthase [Helianthus annuus]KAJ0757764.1 putative 1-aminocyclopropane-1-carboxylate synthase [Helianthus annuus]
MAIEIVQVQPSVGLSKMAVSQTHGEDSPYFAGWKAYDENPYHETNNPSGVIQMGLAENQVSFDMLEEYLETNLESTNWGQKVSGFRENALFQDYHGLLSFRKAMASFMEQVRGGKAKFNPDRVVLTAGATAANELLTFILADPGDALLVPTPYYPGFDRDLRWRTGVQIVPIHCDSSNGFQITPEALEAAYDHATKMNIKVRGVLITNPSNPLGATVQRKVLEEILEFVTRKNIHLVSDEIYSGSAFCADEFVSIAEVLESRKYKDSERCHIVYSLSKDLGLPGFRVGTVYSYNDQVVTTARRMSSFTLISSQTQFLLASMLSDTDFTQKYIKINRERLKKRYEMIVNGLKKAGIECLKGNAGLFCWMNLSPYLEEPTIKSELAIWNTIMHEVRLNISPGSSCHCSEPGWFRVCFANMSEETLEVALSRIHAFIKERKQVL